MHTICLRKLHLHNVGGNDTTSTQYTLMLRNSNGMPRTMSGHPKGQKPCQNNRTKLLTRIALSNKPYIFVDLEWASTQLKAKDYIAIYSWSALNTTQKRTNTKPHTQAPHHTDHWPIVYMYMLIRTADATGENVVILLKCQFLLVAWPDNLTQKWVLLGHFGYVKPVNLNLHATATRRLSLSVPRGIVEHGLTS